MFDVDGGMWFTDLGRIHDKGKDFGGLYCARPDGSAITRIKSRGGSERAIFFLDQYGYSDVSLATVRHILAAVAALAITMDPAHRPTDDPVTVSQNLDAFADRLGGERRILNDLFRFQDVLSGYHFEVLRETRSDQSQ